MLTCSLGQFELHLDPIGKLRQLILPDATALLHACDYGLDTGQGRVFSPCGWDECFPSIEGTGEVSVMGDLAWQAPQVYRAANQVEQVWQMPTYMAQRVFQLRAPEELKMIFRVKASDAGLRFLWASHAIFSINGLRSVLLSDGQRMDEFRINGTCRKFFVRAGSPVCLERENCRIYLETDQPYWGIWYNRGGWPADKPARFACIGIEATNTPADSPADATIPAGGAFEGRVLLRVCEGDVGKMRDLIILGTGVHGLEMAEIVARINRVLPTWNLLGHIAPPKHPDLVGQMRHGWPVLGTIDAIDRYPAALLVPDNEFPHDVPIPRERLTSLVDPSCFVSPAACIGPGCVIYPNSYVGHSARLGQRVFALAGCVINHDDVLEDRVVLCSGVSLAGQVHVEADCYLGQACTVRQFVRIGRNSLIGMGSVVLHDVEANSVMVGNPARKLRERQ